MRMKGWKERGRGGGEHEHAGRQQITQTSQPASQPAHTQLTARHAPAPTARRTRLSVRSRSFKMYSWYHSGLAGRLAPCAGGQSLEAAATSSMALVACWETPMMMPCGRCWSARMNRIVNGQQAHQYGQAEYDGKDGSTIPPTLTIYCSPTHRPSVPRGQWQPRPPCA
jgi:hypothetical protein